MKRTLITIIGTILIIIGSGMLLQSYGQSQIGSRLADTGVSLFPYQASERFNRFIRWPSTPVSGLVFMAGVATLLLRKRVSP